MLENFKLYFSADTGDYLTPYEIPASCLVSARRRLDGFNELEAPDVLRRSGLDEYPAEYWVVTGQEAKDAEGPPPLASGMESEDEVPSRPPPAAGPPKEKRPETPPQRARGSNDPKPQEQSSRGSGAGTPRLVLKEAPRPKLKAETPPGSPRRVPDWTSKKQTDVSGSTREAEYGDPNPDQTAKDNKKTYKIPQQPKDEPPEKGDVYYQGQDGHRRADKDHRAQGSVLRALQCRVRSNFEDLPQLRGTPRWCSRQSDRRLGGRCRPCYPTYG